MINQAFAGMGLSHEAVLIKDFNANGVGWAREPVLRRMPDGSLLCLHYTGGPHEPDDANYTEVTRSYDDGQTWSGGEKLFTHPLKAVWTPEMFVDGADVYAMVHTFDTANWYCGLNIHYAKSSDSGKSWTEPVSLPGVCKCFSHRRMLTTSQGKWLFPIYCQERTEGFDVCFDRENISHGKRWQFCTAAMICEPGFKNPQVFGYAKDANGINLWENNAVEIEDGRFVMFMRASGTGVLYKTESNDCGKTWSKSAPTDIPNGDSKITLHKIGDSVVLLGNQCKDRSCLSLWVSKDGCKSWSKKIELAKIADPQTFPKIKHNEMMICYPDGFVDYEKELLYIAFENGISHFLMKVPFADFL